MQKKNNYHHLALLIFAPPLIAICLCAAFLIPKARGFLNSSAYPDYLWSLRITKALSDKGYPVHDVTILEGESQTFRVIDVQIGNLVNDEEVKAYDIVKEVHSVIMETFQNESTQPRPANVIDVMVIDYNSGSYDVFTDYDVVDRFYKGEISEQEYFTNWSYPENTPGITPP